MPVSRRMAPRLVSAPGSYESPRLSDAESLRYGSNSTWRPARNGVPESRHYDPAGRRAAERARDDAVAAEIAAVRARLTGEVPEPPPAPPAPDGRCGECGYLLTAPGHRAECGDVT
jgi:hypothetical protein